MSVYIFISLSAQQRRVDDFLAFIDGAELVGRDLEFGIKFSIFSCLRLD